jgi:formylmethanofuran dehydrogenase subunit E
MTFRRSRSVDMPRELVRAADFHTHLGPYLVVGLRMGRVVTRELGSEPFTYRVRARTGKRPPYSCLVDGIQVATPCTTGNGGLEVEDDRAMSIEVAAETGMRLVVSLRSEIYRSIEDECTEENQERFALRIWEMPENELLSIEHAESRSQVDAPSTTPPGQA